MEKAANRTHGFSCLVSRFVSWLLVGLFSNFYDRISVKLAVAGSRRVRVASRRLLVRSAEKVCKSHKENVTPKTKVFADQQLDYCDRGDERNETRHN